MKKELTLSRQMDVFLDLIHASVGRLPRRIGASPVLSTAATLSNNP